MSKLTRAQEVFISEYLKCFNGTEAYSRAYPRAKRDSARANATDLLAKTHIQTEIDRRLKEIHMSADEALKLQSDIARGDITEFITPFGNIDIDLLKNSGRGKLVKKIKQKTVTKIGKSNKDDDVEILETEIELYPADVAQERILKILGKFKENLDLTSKGDKIELSDDERTARIIAILDAARTRRNRRTSSDAE